MKRLSQHEGAYIYVYVCVCVCICDSDSFFFFSRFEEFEIVFISNISYIWNLCILDDYFICKNCANMNNYVISI